MNPVGFGKDPATPVGGQLGPDLQNLIYPKVSSETSFESFAQEMLKSLFEQIRAKDERIKELTDILLRRDGLLEEKIVVPSYEPKEVRPHKARFDNVRVALEKHYRKTEQELKEANEPAKVPDIIPDF